MAIDRRRTTRYLQIARLESLIPFAVALLLLVAAPRFGGPKLSNAPDLLGMPLGLAVAGLALAWSAFAAVIVWRTGSARVATLALVFISLPSIVALILSPAIILILQNLP